jgi:ORF6N domain-containing protein
MPARASREKQMIREAFTPKIYRIRSAPVVLDTDLALLYGVETRVFNQAIPQKSASLPSGFCLSANRAEFANLMSQIVISSSHGGRRKLPWVFTEHGAIMAATIFNSERAVAMGVCVARAFVKMRRELPADATLQARLEKIEKTLITHDTALRDVYQKLKPLLLPPPDKPRRRIGFHTEESE